MRIDGRHGSGDNFEIHLRILPTQHNLQHPTETKSSIRRTRCGGSPHYKDTIGIFRFIHWKHKRLGCPGDVWVKESPGKFGVVIVRRNGINFVFDSYGCGKTVADQSQGNLQQQEQKHDFQLHTRNMLPC